VTQSPHSLPASDRLSGVAAFVLWISSQAAFLVLVYLLLLHREHGSIGWFIPGSIFCSVLLLLSASWIFGQQVRRRLSRFCRNPGMLSGESIKELQRCQIALSGCLLLGYLVPIFLILSTHTRTGF
jgi:hypothetical protein